jgi:hypothetical protein
MRHSDLIVPHGVQNDIALQFISENLKNKLLSRGILIKTPKNQRHQLQFRIMFDILDDVLIQYQTYSKQIFTIKNEYRDSISKEEEHKQELEILRT